MIGCYVQLSKCLQALHPVDTLIYMAPAACIPLESMQQLTGTLRMMSPQCLHMYILQPSVSARNSLCPVYGNLIKTCRAILGQLATGSLP